MMKLGLASVTAALLVFSASSAEASLLLEVTLASPAQNATSPSFVTFDGTIRNIGTEPVTIVGDGLSAPAGVGVDLPQSDIILGNFPITLNPGDSFFASWLFGLQIPATQTTSFGGTYSVFGEDSQGNPLVPFTADYRVNLTPVPEPTTMLLFATGLLGLGVRRCRGRLA